MTRTGGQLVVDALEAFGVDVVFCVPGESYLPILDALHDSPIRLISCRHEAAAANMAEAYGKLTGRPGVCLVTRGPGATHAAVGVHTAWQDSTPMLLLVGQVPRAFRGREAFQEIDVTAVFGSQAKWTGEAPTADHLPGMLHEAVDAARSRAPGPVVLALPEDVLTEVAEPRPTVRLEVSRSPVENQLSELVRLLEVSQRPLVIVGEGGWNESCARDVVAFCEANELSVATSFRCQDYVDNTSRVYAGHLTIGMDPKLAQRVQDADLILAIGGRLGDVTTRGYTLLEPPRPKQTLIHADPGPYGFGRVYEPALGIAANLAEVTRALAGLPTLQHVATWGEWTAAARADYEANLRHSPWPGDGVDMGEVMAFLRRRLPADAILACGAGNFTVWAHRFYEFRRYGTQLAPRSGAMGYGFPAALSAKVLHPERLVVCIAGDGDFMMSCAELATAMQYDLPVVTLIVNNGMYGTIRMHQERHYPGRVVGTDLVNPDFAAFARAFGAYGETVERTEEVEASFERAVESGKPALVELRVDPEQISPRHTISELRGGR